MVQGIKYVSLYEPSGYGNTAKRYMKGLAKAGIPLTWTPMVPGRSWGMGYEPFQGVRVGDPDLDYFCNRNVDYDTVIVHTVPEYYPLWKEREPSRAIVGCTVWETDHLPFHWPALLNLADLLLVPCRWNKTVFEKCGVTAPIRVIPYICEGENPSRTDALMGIPADHYAFYTIGTWTVRKALWNTITAYLETFGAGDRTVLIVKTTERDFTRKFFNRFYGRTRWSVWNLLWRYRKPAPIKLITEPWSEDEMLRLHGRGDCYVSLCRSEGWGLGAFDAAAFGKPVIITGFGGQLDYLPEELAYLVEYEFIPVQDPLGERSYSANQNWAEPRIEDGSRLMRLVYEQKEKAARRGEQLSKYVREHFSESKIMDKLLNQSLNRSEPGEE